MNLVEVAGTDATRHEVVEAVVAWLARLGKTPVRVGDQPGYAMNRLLSRDSGERPSVV